MPKLNCLQCTNTVQYCLALTTKSCIAKNSTKVLASVRIYAATGADHVSLIAVDLHELDLPCCFVVQTNSDSQLWTV